MGYYLSRFLMSGVFHDVSELIRINKIYMQTVRGCVGTLLSLINPLNHIQYGKIPQKQQLPSKKLSRHIKQHFNIPEVLWYYQSHYVMGLQICVS